MSEGPKALEPITFHRLRLKGFRLTTPFGNYEPHMRIGVSREVDSYLEIGRCGLTEMDWSIWIVSEISHRYGRFCFLRSARTMGQVSALYDALTDHALPDEESDPAEFAEALARSTEFCVAHWRRIYTDEAMRRHILTK